MREKGNGGKSFVESRETAEPLPLLISSNHFAVVMPCELILGFSFVSRHMNGEMIARIIFFLVK